MSDIITRIDGEWTAGDRPEHTTRAAKASILDDLIGASTVEASGRVMQGVHIQASNGVALLYLGELKMLGQVCIDDTSDKGKVVARLSALGACTYGVPGTRPPAGGQRVAPPKEKKRAQGRPRPKAKTPKEPEV